ncbi:NAD(P)-dependent dehydrogenase (short-subunit alcohol dehydrogenase family) [Arthrobacter sp. CAN_A214]|uniref:oxidoreductase n=1 Tax=Arthrobacter sp. CAN_A214 TaxID=2787720 RepID=UPI0018CBEAA2
MSPFTADSIPDQTGRTIVITGANSGIGHQAATALARKGARVVLACRDEGRGHDAEKRIRSLSGSSTVELRLLDLSSLASVRRFADEWTGPLDVLINNAGVMATPRKVTEDGFEQQFGINHLGHFALTGLLLEHLQEAEAPRVVSVSSLAHKRGRINFADLQSTKRYRRWSAYQQSKVANLYFMIELDRRTRAAGWPLASVAAHPGLANTNLTAGMNLPTALDAFGVFFKLLSQSDAAGALPVLYAATAPDVQGGDYYGPDGPGETRGNATLVAPSSRVLDRDIATRLWNKSAELTGVSYATLPQPA